MLSKNAPVRAVEGKVSKHYKFQCEYCGHIGTSDTLIERRYHDDYDVECPACHLAICANEVEEEGSQTGDEAKP